MLRVALCLAFQGPSPTPVEGAASTAEPVREEASRESRSVALYVRGLPTERLLRDLALRSPKLSFELRTGSSRGSGPETTIVLVRPRPSGFALTVLLDDGRAFDRDIEAPEEVAARVVATALANLLAAIAEERIAADRSDVDIAEELAVEDPALVRGLSGSTAAESASSAAPKVEATDEHGRRPSQVEDPDQERLWSLGASLLPMTILSLGAGDSSPLAGAGAGLNIIAEAPRGLRLGAGLRGGWVGRTGHSLHRYRISLVGGYQLRRRGFVLAADALVGVEPWQVRRSGERVALDLSGDDSSGDEPSTVALAMGLRLAPAVELAVGARERARLRLGALAEFSYSGVLVEGLRAVNIGPEGQGAIFRVGGPELMLGLHVGIDVDLHPR